MRNSAFEFLLSPTRDAEAAQRFFCKALHVTVDVAPQTSRSEGRVTSADPITSVPRVINVDKNAAYPKAMIDLKAAGVLPEHVELRQVKCLNSLIEQDHRFRKRLTKPGMGFFSFETAERTLHEYEVMSMIRKGHRRGVEKGEKMCRREQSMQSCTFLSHERPSLRSDFTASHFAPAHLVATEKA